jgi:hypothetical protein
MQYRYNSDLIKHLKNYKVGILIKILVLGVVVYYLIAKLYQEEHLIRKILNEINYLYFNNSIIYIFLPILLVALNWSVEGKKWQILSAKILPLSFKQALTGVLSGLSLGFITPQSVGDYAGRIWQINNSRRYELIGSVFLGSLIQASISIAMGFFGFIYFLKANHNPLLNEYNFIIIFLSLTGLGFGFIYFTKNKIKLRIFPIFLISWWQKYLGIISTYSFGEISNLFLLSLIRYFIFFFQFVWVLVLFGIDLPVDVLCAGVSWVFAAKTLIPAFNFLSDIGIREFSALVFFNLYQADVTKIILASLFIWIINILVPTLAGSFLVLRMRIFAK